MVFTIRDVMGDSFLAAEAGLSVREGARRMVTARHGYLLLLEEGRAVGIVTEWDLVDKVIARGLDPATVTLGSIASRPVLTCDEATPTTDVVDLMVRRGIRRMVVTGGGKVTGVVESRNLLRSFGSFIDRVSSDIARLHSSYP